MRIGLLEDDPAQIELIKLWTEDTGDELDSYSTGSSFRDAVGQQGYDLLILDWHLPDTSGIEILEWLRKQQGSSTPVLFITSRDSEESVVEALEQGADDYMVKPVSKNVTTARIKALARRHQIETDASSDKQPYAPYQVDESAQQISCDGELVTLTSKEYELAAYLFRYAGNLLSREHLLNTIWGTRGDLNTRTVDTHISRIRTKLGINPNRGWQLRSIYQRGYRLSRVSQDQA